MIVWNAKLFIEVPKVVDGSGKEMNATECYFSRGMHERAEFGNEVSPFLLNCRHLMHENVQKTSYTSDCVRSAETIIFLKISFRESRHSS